MTDFIDDVDTEEWEEFERLGRRAGAELRTAPPDAAIEGIERAVHRRAMTRVVAGTLAVVLLAGAAFAMFRGREGVDETPVDQTTEPTVPLPSGAPGTWRELADPGLEVNTALAVTAAWTGAEVIVLSVRNREPFPLIAAGYDVRDDTWRPLAAPPDELKSPVGTAWTGSELLAADRQGHVFSYDPVSNQWRARSAQGASVLWPESESLVAVSSEGVLARSRDGWWWYEESTDEWAPLPPPDPRFEGTLPLAVRGRASLDVLAPTSFMLATDVDDRILLTLFDAPSGTWTPAREVMGPAADRGAPICEAADGRIVCWAEGFGNLSGVVVEVPSGATTPFVLEHGASSLRTVGTPWFGHAWSLLLARSATWEALPTLEDVQGFGVAVWDGQELLMFGGTDESGEPASVFAAAYTPVVKP